MQGQQQCLHGDQLGRTHILPSIRLPARAPAVQVQVLEHVHCTASRMHMRNILSLAITCRFVLVHFYHPEFETCKVMDKHLRIIAAKPRGMATKFLKIEGMGSWCPCSCSCVNVAPSLEHANYITSSHVCVCMQPPRLRFSLPS